MSKITQISPNSTRLRRSGLEAKLWPNGEIAFHLPKLLKEAPQIAPGPRENRSIYAWLITVKGLGTAVKRAVLMGLSSVPNFDKPVRAVVRSGSRGITALGRRRVRNAAYMLTREAGKNRLTFSTVTLPSLSCEEMTVLHLNWNKVIDRYRLLVSRHLRAGGLTGEIVGVSEVQEKRYESTGFPVLHCHFVFIGRGRGGGWVLSPQRHDYIWRKSLQSVLPLCVPDVTSACQLKSVEKDAEGYLGKYMSKGGLAIAEIVTNGYDWALPLQWWNCSRSLVRRMDSSMRYFTEGAAWLVQKAAEKDEGIWAFYSVVSIEMQDGQFVDVGSYGRLTKQANGQVREFLGLK